MSNIRTNTKHSQFSSAIALQRTPSTIKQQRGISFFGSLIIDKYQIDIGKNKQFGNNNLQRKQYMYARHQIESGRSGFSGAAAVLWLLEDIVFVTIHSINRR